MYPSNKYVVSPVSKNSKLDPNNYYIVTKREPSKSEILKKVFSNKSPNSSYKK